MAVRTDTLVNGSRLLVIAINNDGDDESGVIKVNAGTMTGPDGVADSGAFRLQKVQWSVWGWAGANLLFDATTDTLITSLAAGHGELRFPGGIQDPQGTGSTRDVLLTTVGSPSGAAGYSIVLEFIKVAKD